MTSYILKTINKEEEVLLYQEKVKYSFTPKKSYKWINKVSVLSEDLLNKIWIGKITRDYNKILNIIYKLVESDDTTSGDVLKTYNEIERIKEYLLKLAKDGLERKIVNKYLEKLYVLELELKKVHVIELKEEIGRGR